MNKNIKLISAFLLTLTITSFTKKNCMNEPTLLPAIHQYLTEVEKEFSTIPNERKEVLKTLAEYIKQSQKQHNTTALTFICTHNSRRSHLAQIWAKAAATYYHIPNVVTYSGGTEVTAFNINAVNALKEAGFEINADNAAVNPIYHVTFSNNGLPIKAFSKKYTDAPNPKENYAAIMTCSSADKACPIVFGASKKIVTTYEDPKLSDGTPEQKTTYSARSKQIATELLYAFSLVNN